MDFVIFGVFGVFVVAFVNFGVFGVLGIFAKAFLNFAVFGIFVTAVDSGHKWCILDIVSVDQNVEVERRSSTSKLD